MRAVSRCRPRQQAAQGQDAERRVLQKASVVRRPSCPVGCPSGARPAPTRGYQRRPFCPASTTTRALRGFANNSKTQSAVSDFLSHTKQRTQERNQLGPVCFIHRRPPRTPATRTSATPAGYELAGRADLAMGVGGEGVPRSPDAHAGASRPLSRSCLQRSRGRSIPAICDPLENPGSIGGSVRDT